METIRYVESQLQQKIPTSLLNRTFRDAVEKRQPVSADQREIMVRSNKVFRSDMDGVFMGLGRYQR